MSRTFEITLPWPPSPLWQNRPSHWGVKRAAVKHARGRAWAKAQLKKIPADPRAVLAFEFHPPDSRRRDLHNMPATQKATIDGIAAAMGVDDEHFRVRWPEAWAEVRKGGAVVVTITTEEE